MHALHRWFVLSCLAAACSPADPTAPPPTPEVSARTGIDGCNCAGAAPVMTAPDGGAYVFQSVVAYYYKVLDAFWTRADDDVVLETSLAPEIEATSEAFVTWQAKTIQILRDRDLLGFTYRYYRGIFGFLDAPAPSEVDAVCRPALDDPTRTIAMLAHVALSQAGVCGKNDDNTTKFWQVNNIALLAVGDVVDSNALIAAGLAEPVTHARASRCILPAPGVRVGPIVLAQPVVEDPDPELSCQVAFRADAVTEAVVMPVPSSAFVAGVPLGARAFTAAGTVEMPNALDEVRTILRSAQLRAMYAVGLPRFVAEPASGPTFVRLVGHRIGPARAPSEVLMSDERAWVDQTVGRYEDACCAVVCDDAGGPVARFAGLDAGTDAETGSDTGSGSDSGSGPGSGSGSDGGGGPCHVVCKAEGVCETSSATTGIVVMVAAVTTKECAGSCPEPASDAPAEAPVCTP